MSMGNVFAVMFGAILILIMIMFIMDLVRKRGKK